MELDYAEDVYPSDKKEKEKKKHNSLECNLYDQGIDIEELTDTYIQNDSPSIDRKASEKDKD